LLNRLDFEGAGHSFRRAIAMDSTFALAYYRLAYTEWWSRGQQDIARKHVAYAMRNLERVPVKERYLVRALSAGLAQGFEAQLVILKEMRRLHPDDKEMLFGLGDAEFHSGNVDSSIVHFKAALAIDPMMERALQHLAWAYQGQGHDDEALAAARRWTDSTHSIEAYEFLAGCYARVGNPDAAIEAINVARARAPEDPLVPIRMASILFILRRPDAALAQADLAEGLLPATGAFYARGELLRLRAGVLYPYVGRYRDVRRVLDERTELLTQAAGDSATLVGVRMAKASLGYWGDQNPARARDALAGIGPEWARHGKGELVQSLIVFNLLAGDSARAGQVQRSQGQLLTPQGRRVVAAVRACVQGDCPGAAALAIQSEADPGAPRALRDVLHYLAGVCDLDAGRPDAAIAELLGIVNAPVLSPDSAPIYPAAYFQLGRAYDATGNVAGARSAYETLLSMWRQGDAALPFRIQAEARLRALNRAM